MLTLYRRHLSTCRHRSRRERRCGCPIWIQGTLRGQSVRKALNLTAWEAAQEAAREMELGITRTEPTPVSDAIRLFLEDIQARQLSRESVKKHRALTKALQTYANERGFEIPGAVRSPSSA